jgi:quercetin dioxygenase-like cupin family protein
MPIRLQLDRIPPGVEVGPHRHGAETIVYVAGGEIVFEHGERLQRRALVRAGDVLYEAPAEYHVVRNEGAVDALALLAVTDRQPRRAGDVLERWDSSAEPVRRHEDAEVATRAGIASRLLVRPGDFGSPTFSVAEIELAPGTADDWHRHAGAEHALVVLEGRGRITVGEHEETLEPLAGIRIEPGRPHRVANPGRRALRYVVCASPGIDPRHQRERVEAPRRLDA